MSDLVGIPEDIFSHDAVDIVSVPELLLFVDLLELIRPMNDLLGHKPEFLDK